MEYEIEKVILRFFLHVLFRRARSAARASRLHGVRAKSKQRFNTSRACLRAKRMSEASSDNTSELATRNLYFFCFIFHIPACYTCIMSFLSKKTKNECVLVFDIGSGSVGGAIVLISPGAIPNILYSFRSEMPFQEKATGARLFSLMSRSLSQVVMALSREGFEAAGFGAQRPRIEKILVSLSAPWMVALGTFLQLRNKEPMVVTETVFATLLEHFDKSENGLVENIPKECKSMEGHLQWSVLNGYRTAAA